MLKKWLRRLLIISFICCATATAMDHEGAAVAVWDLENLTPLDPAVADMGELLSAKVIETFKESQNYTVVERERLLLALEELNLGSSAVVSESSRLEIGRIVGARLMIFGSYMVLNNLLRLDLRMVEVETGSILTATSKTMTGIDPIEWLKITQAAAEELLLVKPPYK